MMKFVEKCVAFFNKINYTCNNNITYDYTAGMQMQKSLCDGTEWLVSNFNMLNACFIVKETETVKKANRRSVQ